jgi:hypothetical protein
VQDGSGYPSGLAGNAISAWGRILSLAQVVAALVNRGHSHAALRLSVLLRTNRHRFDPSLVDRLLPLLKQITEQSTEAGGLDNPVPNPVASLNRIYQALLNWPAMLGPDAQLTPSRRKGLVFLGDRRTRILRTFVESGVSPEQLRILGRDALTERLADELSLIAQELAWQLRALEREVRRRWALAINEQWPDGIAQWVNQAEAICNSLIPSDDSYVKPQAAKNI